MRTRLFLSTILVFVILGLYTFFNLPFVRESVVYTSLISPYSGVINKWLLTVFILSVVYFISVCIDLILETAFAKVMRGNGLAKKLFPLVRRTVTLFVWAVGGIFILSSLGVNISALLTGAWVGGIFFALAGKEAASNLFGSLSLIFSHLFEIGDTIRVKGYEGRVEEISLSYTRLLDKKGNIVYMPNKNIISETIENLSSAKVKQLEFAVTLSSSLSSTETDKWLINLEKSIKKLSKEHGEFETKVSYDGIGETGQNIVLKVFISIADTNELKKEVWMAIKGELDRTLQA